MGSNVPLVVFSHLRWNFVFQRPQHVLSRLARRHPVLLIEEPLPGEPGIESRWERSRPAHNVTVLAPRIRAELFTPSFKNAEMRQMVRSLSADSSLDQAILWTYTPSAVTLVREFERSLIVYDCMDELSAFLHAPQELRDQEKELMKLADIVFTGGPSLYRAKKDLHPEVYCFPSSVEVAHFEAAKSSSVAEAADQVGIPHPRLGFVGVIDERTDLAILQQMAMQKPDWQIVLVGPVVKIDPNTLPKLPNIHYMGARQYSELPSYLKGWDVCLMPFALNESTRFISPTKVLEYMAAGKPIVSTAITDVVEPYSSIVRIGQNADDFIRQCGDALSASQEDRSQRQVLADAVLSQTSWDRTAEAMVLLMESHLQEIEASSSRDVSHAVAVPGAGQIGHGTAYRLGASALLVGENEFDK